jgi:hypothetical protein
MDSDYAIGTVEFHPQLSKPEYRKNCLTGRQRDNLTRKRPGHACVRADAPSRRMPNHSSADPTVSARLTATRSRLRTGPPS